MKHHLGDGCLGDKVVPFPREELRAIELARWIVAHDDRLALVSISDEDNPLGLDLRLESCVLCGGFFAPHGEAAIFYRGPDEFPNDGPANYLHVGCRAEARNWAHLGPEEPTTRWRPYLLGGTA